jgi:hypothetical protein
LARKTLTDKGVDALKPRAARYAHPDPELSGHFVRIQPSSAKSYCAVARDPSSKQVWTTIGSTEILTIAEARVNAREIIRRVRDGLPAVEPSRFCLERPSSPELRRPLAHKGAAFPSFDYF